jgi:hypothetical protein
MGEAIQGATMRMTKLRLNTALFGLVFSSANSLELSCLLTLSSLTHTVSDYF